MADEQTTTSSAPNGGRKKGKLKDFIKKNKTLSAVVGLGGLYFLFKETQGGGESVVEEPNGEQNIVSPGGPYEPVESSHEGTDQEIARVEEEVKVEREERETLERENENKEGGEAPENPGTETAESTAPEGSVGSGEGGESGNTGSGHNGLSINGKEFKGATGKSIVGTGTSDGGKKWIEYLITFPGRQEHWRYWPASNNWSQVKNSATGPGSGKKPTEGNKQPTNNPTHGGGSPPPPKTNPSHPGAINTGNRCVNGGVGPHTAPKGYHLWCENGWIWRAPDNVGVAPGKPVSKPKPSPSPAPAPRPTPAPSPPQCPAGTVANIQHARGEVQRLTNEINSLQANKPKGWAANVASKQATRADFQGAVDRGRQQPGCGNV